MLSSSEPFRIADLMRGFHHPWAFCGGWAIDLFIGHQTRPHKDVDITILRQHQHAAHTYLSSGGWYLEVAHNGELTPWNGKEFLRLPLHTIWCKNPDNDPSFLEILLNEADDRYLYFRRDKTIKIERERAFVETASGLRIFAPEVVILYKAKDANDKENELDFRNVREQLSEKQREWLREGMNKMYSGHEWLYELGVH